MEFIEQKCVCINYNNICPRPQFLATRPSDIPKYICIYIFLCYFSIFCMLSAGISFGELFALCRKFAVVKIVSCVPFTGHGTQDIELQPPSPYVRVYRHNMAHTNFHDIP